VELVCKTVAPSSDNPKITQAEEFYDMLEAGCMDAEHLVSMIRAGQMRQLTALSTVRAEMNAE